MRSVIFPSSMHKDALGGGKCDCEMHKAPEPSCQTQHSSHKASACSAQPSTPEQLAGPRHDSRESKARAGTTADGIRAASKAALPG